MKRHDVPETTVTFRMPVALKLSVQALARARGQSVTAFVCQVLRENTTPESLTSVVARRIEDGVEQREARLRERLIEAEADLDAAKRVISKLKNLLPGSV